MGAKPSSLVRIELLYYKRAFFHDLKYLKVSLVKTVVYIVVSQSNWVSIRSIFRAQLLR